AHPEPAKLRIRSHQSSIRRAARSRGHGLFHQSGLRGDAGLARGPARNGVPVMSKITRGLLCVALLSCLALPAAQAQNPDANIVVTQAWSRATPGGSKVAGGYLTVENKGSAPDRLLSASTNAAKKIEVHQMAVNEGVMTMR